MEPWRARLVVRDGCAVQHLDLLRRRTRWRLVGCRWQEVWCFRRGLCVVWWVIRRSDGVRVRWFGRSHHADTTTFVACRAGCIRMRCIISGDTAVIRSVSCVRPILSEPVRFIMWSIRRALPRMLILLRLLRHRYTGVLGTIRTSKWREGTSASIARMVMV